MENDGGGGAVLACWGVDEADNRGRAGIVNGRHYAGAWRKRTGGWTEEDVRRKLITSHILPPSKKNVMILS